MSKDLKENYYGYVMSYFGQKIESLRLAYSTDGLNWTKLNNGEHVLAATLGSKRVRDPFIYRKPDGKFMIISTQGWDTNSIYLWDSEDLCSFTNERLIQVNNFSNRAWAPECIYDEKHNRHVIFWSANPVGTNANRIYCTYTEDFINFSEAHVLFDPGYEVIDGNIVVHNNKFYMFFKDERGENIDSNTTKAIKIAVSENMNPGSFEILTEDYITDFLVEGPACIKSLTEEKWYVYYDYFMRGGIWGCSASTNLDDPNSWIRLKDEEYSLPADVRHGNATPVTKEELDKIVKKWSDK